MASVSSLGVGSNLDLNSLLDQLAGAERLPVVALQQQQVSYNARLSAYGKLQGALGALQASATKLADPLFFQGVKAASSAADVLTASASATAAPGSYALAVSQLAQAQSLAAAGQASATAAVGIGTVTISWGQISGGTLDPATGKYAGAGFAADASRTPVDVVIDGSNNSLEGIRDAINRKTDAGVTASIVNDGGASPYRLVLSSTRAGDNASLKISVAGDASLQGLLDHDSSATQNLQQTAAAQNARLSVNGVPVTSATNTVTDSIQGVSLNLLKTGASQLNVQRDSGTVSAAINEFVNSYNALQATMGQLTAYNTESRNGAALVGDSTLRMIQTRVRATLNTPQAGNLQVLSKIGVTFQKDGTLQADAAKLGAALSTNLAGVAEMMSSANPNGGYGKQMSTLIEGFSKSEGALQVATNGVKTSIKTLGTRIAQAQERVDSRVAIYRAQFTQLDLMMSRMTSTGAYLTQQFSNMNPTK